MSDYLTNLVRRSVGLTPLVAPRGSPAPLMPDVVADAPAAAPASAARPSVEPSVAAAVTNPPVQIHMHAAEPPAAIQVLPGPIPVEPLRTDRRAPELESVVPEPARIETRILVPSNSPAAAPPAAPPVESAGARATITQIVAQPVPGPRESRAPDQTAPIVLPARIESVPESVPVPHEIIPVETVRELTQRFEKIIEPVPAAAVAPVVVPLAPAAAPAAHRAPDAPAPENRIVQVRIGSIEIHGAAPAPAPAPAPVAAAAARVSMGGFDQFTRLRNYAQWEW
jgi:hypothetical protein